MSVPSRLTGDDLRHLLRRLTFAATPQTERALAGVTPDAAVTALLASARSALLPAAPASVAAPWVNIALRVPGMRVAQYDAARAAQVEAHRRGIESVRHWWLSEMTTGAAPLREQLTLFFQNTIGSSTAAVEIPHAVYGCNALMRRTCLGRVPDLLEQLVADPAMMMQIGMDEHLKARVSDRPAKLILDYWTVGVGHYQDRDVEELSRALTGWTLMAPRGTEPATAADPNADRVARRTGIAPVFDPAGFDAGQKTLLGETRAFDARSALQFLAHHPATARRFGQQLVRYLGVADPRQQLESRLATTYLATGGSIDALLRAIVRADEFWSQETRWSLIKSPVHLAAGACRQLEIVAPPVAEISRWLTASGQTLFDTPNAGEGGWPGQEAWVTPPDRLAVRYQLPRVLTGQMPPLGIHRQVSSGNTTLVIPVGPALAGASANAILARLDPAPGLDAAAARRRDLIPAVMATPQYQLA